jgi:hypothetical protein
MQFEKIIEKRREGLRSSDFKNASAGPLQSRTRISKIASLALRKNSRQIFV